jgi:hypothetical protein
VPDPLSDLIISSDDSDDDKVSGVPNGCLCKLTFLPRGKIRNSSQSRPADFLPNYDVFSDLCLYPAVEDSSI